MALNPFSLCFFYSCLLLVIFQVFHNLDSVSCRALPDLVTGAPESKAVRVRQVPAQAANLHDIFVGVFQWRWRVISTQEVAVKSRDGFFSSFN